MKHFSNITTECSRTLKRSLRLHRVPVHEGWNVSLRTWTSIEVCSILYQLTKTLLGTSKDLKSRQSGKIQYFTVGAKVLRIHQTIKSRTLFTGLPSKGKKIACLSITNTNIPFVFHSKGKNTGPYKIMNANIPFILIPKVKTQSPEVLNRWPMTLSLEILWSDHLGSSGNNFGQWSVIPNKKNYSHYTQNGKIQNNF